MERIGQADVITILEKLHQELKAQTRDSKVDQHYLLRKSFHYVTATLYKPSQLTQRSSAQGKKLAEVTHRVLQELFALLVGGDGFAPPRIRILSSALVRELSAGETPYFFRDNFGGNFAQYDHNKVKYFLPVLSELSNSKLLIQNITNLVGWFIGEHDNLGLKMAALSNLIALVQRAPNVLDKDKHIRPMEAKFQLILTGASLETRKTTSTKLFGVRIVSTSSSCNVTEVDGTPSRDFFTCMNNSYDYSEDQILNVHVFSSLYYWIFHLYQAQLLEARKKQSREDIISKLEHFGLTRDVAERGTDAAEHQESYLLGSSEGDPARSKESQRLDPIGCFTLDETFREVVISICLRILSQVERDIVLESVSQMRLGSKYIVSDLDWIKEFTEATSMEAVRILDLLCLMDPSLVSCIFPAVKKVYERTANRQSGLVFSAVLQFFVNHGQHVIFDVDPVLHHFFVDYVSVRYRRQLLAMSTLLFLTTNTSKMLLHTPVFPKYYPAIVKLLAWHPRTVASEILPLVPAMVGPMTFTELFHTLLDLPLTAAFMEQYDRPEEYQEVQWNRFGLDRMSPAFKAVQQYIMRNEAGLGGICVWETRDDSHLAMIRMLWKALPVTPRVSSVCKLVPRFLRVYFDVLLTHAPPACIERVVPLLLQRFASLYPVDFFLNAVHSLIIDTLQAIFQQWPSFLLSLRNEVLDAISAHLDVQGRLLVLHLCWIIGELLSPAMCGDCKGDILGFFESLEMLAYEAISDRAEDPADKKRRTLRSLQSSIKSETEGQISASATQGAANAESLRTGGAVGEVVENRTWHEEQSASEHEDQSSVARPENVEEDAPESNVKAESASEVIFTPRFIAVIIASLTKLGTKFPEFSPRVVLCLLKMRQHYDTDFTQGIEFVRDRLTDSLQLLRHSAITNSIYTSQVLPGAQPDRFFSFHLSSLSSLSHISHNPSTFTPGSLLHDFELPPKPPLAQVASSGPVRGDAQRRVSSWLEGSYNAPATSAEPADSGAKGAESAGPTDGGDLWFSNLDRFAELRRAAAVAVQSGARASATSAQGAPKHILGDSSADASRLISFAEASSMLDPVRPPSPPALQAANMLVAATPSINIEQGDLPLQDMVRSMTVGKPPRVLNAAPPGTPPWTKQTSQNLPTTPPQRINANENHIVIGSPSVGKTGKPQQAWQGLGQQPETLGHAPQGETLGVGRHAKHAGHSPASSSSEGSPHHSRDARSETAMNNSSGMSKPRKATSPRQDQGADMSKQNSVESGTVAPGSSTGSPDKVVRTRKPQNGEVDAVQTSTGTSRLADDVPHGHAEAAVSASALPASIFASVPTIASSSATSSATALSASSQAAAKAATLGVVSSAATLATQQLKIGHSGIERASAEEDNYLGATQASTPTAASGFVAQVPQEPHQVMGAGVVAPTSAAPWLMPQPTVHTIPDRTRSDDQLAKKHTGRASSEGRGPGPVGGSPFAPRINPVDSTCAAEASSKVSPPELDGAKDSEEEF